MDTQRLSRGSSPKSRLKPIYGVRHLGQLRHCVPVNCTVTWIGRLRALDHAGRQCDGKRGCRAGGSRRPVVSLLCFALSRLGYVLAPKFPPWSSSVDNVADAANCQESGTVVDGVSSRM